MCEVTSTNFARIYPEIIDEIDRSCFLSIDTEFSSMDTYSSSSLKTLEQFYEHRSNFIRDITIFQFGLAIFFRTNQEQTYKVKIYNFYLHPLAAHHLIDVKYFLRSSSIQFLTEYKFDFNKCFYSGISFLNQTQENLLIQHRQMSWQFSLNEQKFFHHLFEQINQWLIKAQIDDEIQIEFENINLHNYLIQSEVQRCFQTIWITIQTINQKKIFLIRRIEKHVYEENIRTYRSNNTDWNDYLRSIRGFTELIRFIRDKYQKPIVGHNCFLDWLLIYDKFLDRLPSKFQDFQRFMNESIRSSIFDTKYLAFEMKDHLFARQYRSNHRNYIENLTSATSLSSLYDLLTSKTYENWIFFKPTIEILSTDRYQNQTWNHEAGYDAYMSGVIFLKLIYFYKQKQVSKLESNSYQRIFDICLNDIQIYKNRFYSIFSSYISLNRNDQQIYKRKTTQYCLVLEKFNQDKLDLDDIRKCLNTYGCIEYQMNKQSNRIYLLFQSEYCQKQILNDYAQNSIYKIEKYNWFKHQLSYSIGISIFMTGICICLLIKYRL